VKNTIANSCDWRGLLGSFRAFIFLGDEGGGEVWMGRECGRICCLGLEVVVTGGMVLVVGSHPGSIMDRRSFGTGVMAV
jgi:hypothetical protein